MTDLRSALAAVASRSLRPSELVRTFFATDDRAVLRAVNRFVGSTSSPLDLLNLELIAAAAPFIEDGKLAALIERFPRTQLPLEVEPVDRDQLRAAIGRALSDQGPEQRVALVEDLVWSSTKRFLELVPAEHLDGEVLTELRADLRRSLRRAPSWELTALLRSDLIDDDLAVEACERVVRERTRPGVDADEWRVEEARLRVRIDDRQWMARALALGNRRAMNDVAFAPGLSEDVAEWLSEHPDDEVRARLAGNRGALPASVVRRLAHDTALEVRQAAAARADAPSELLRELAATEGAAVLEAVGGNPSTPPDVLRELLSVAKGRRRLLLAVNPSLPSDLLAQLSADPNERVRHGVMANPGTPVEVLRTMCDGVPLSRWQHVLVNPVAPPDLFRRAIEEAGRTKPWAVMLRSEAMPPELIGEVVERSGAEDAALYLGQNAAVLDGRLRLPRDVWQAVSPYLDPHVRARIASLPSDGVSRPLGHPAVDDVGATDQALSLGIAVEGPAWRWRKLPNVDDLPLPVRAPLDLLEQSELGGEAATVVRTIGELRELRRRMGNCLESCEAEIREGKVVVAAYEAPGDDVYAVGWRMGRAGGWTLVDANSIGNRGLPAGIAAEVQEITSRLDAEGRRAFTRPQPRAARRRAAGGEVAAQQPRRGRPIPGDGRAIGEDGLGGAAARPFGRPPRPDGGGRGNLGL